VYIKELTDGRFPFAVKNRNAIPLSEFSGEKLIVDRGIQIGIAMNFLNVHVNRSPIAGIVTLVKRIPGRFASLKHIASLLENERVLMVFENEHLRVGIVMIASRLVRRIVAYVEDGERLAQGQRVGMIRFGSQVDVLLPHHDELAIVAKVGDEVTAGETVLIRGISHIQSKGREAVAVAQAN
jgi:phosphatidylserine decarboxylase